MSAYAYAGADWLKDGISAEAVSPFGEQVANILGDAFFGIYHLDYVSLKKADWKNNDWIQVTVCGGLSTYDNDGLTRLVVLCHDRLVRLEIRAAAPKYLRLCFSPRKSRDGHMFERHPTLEDAMVRIRDHYQASPKEQSNG